MLGLERLGRAVTAVQAAIQPVAWSGRPPAGVSTAAPTATFHGHVPRPPRPEIFMSASSPIRAPSEEPTDALRRAAGVYEVAGDELRRSDRPVPEDMKRCTRVALDLP